MKIHKFKHNDIILVHDTIHTKILKKKDTVINLDLSKDFDNISWHFIKHTLPTFGFSHRLLN